MYISKKNLKMISAGLAAAMLVLTMTGCSSPETGDASKAEVKESNSSAAESSEEAQGEESKAEPESSEEETENTESSEAATTSAPDEFDLDAMIASIEADIPDITAYSGIDINIDPILEDTSSTAEAGTTTTTTMPEANAPAVSDLKSYQQFTFDGMTYDNANILNSAVTVPSGWEDKGRSSKDYKNPLYPDYDIVVSDKAAQFIKTKNDGGDKPSLKLYKGLTWGASVSDIKAAYGEPVHEGSSGQYGTNFTNMFYKDSNDLLIIYQVSDDWGLAGILCQGKN